MGAKCEKEELIVMVGGGVWNKEEREAFLDKKFLLLRDMFGGPQGVVFWFFLVRAGNQCRDPPRGLYRRKTVRSGGD